MPVFAYQVRWHRQPEPFATILGATHTIDHPFWLQTFAENGNDYEMQPVGFSQGNEPGRVDLAQQMGVLFRNFLRNGDPNLGEAPPRASIWEEIGVTIQVVFVQMLRPSGWYFFLRNLLKTLKRQNRPHPEFWRSGRRALTTIFVSSTYLE